MFYIYKAKSCGVIDCRQCVQNDMFFTYIHFGIVSPCIDYGTIDVFFYNKIGKFIL